MRFLDIVYCTSFLSLIISAKVKEPSSKKATIQFVGHTFDAKFIVQDSSNAKSCQYLSDQDPPFLTHPCAVDVTTPLNLTLTSQCRSGPSSPFNAWWPLSGLVAGHQYYTASSGGTLLTYKSYTPPANGSAYVRFLALDDCFSCFHGSRQAGMPVEITGRVEFSVNLQVPSTTVIAFDPGNYTFSVESQAPNSMVSVELAPNTGYLLAYYFATHPLWENLGGISKHKGPDEPSNPSGFNFPSMQQPPQTLARIAMPMFSDFATTSPTPTLVQQPLFIDGRTPVVVPFQQDPKIAQPAGYFISNDTTLDIGTHGYWFAPFRRQSGPEGASCSYATFPTYPTTVIILPNADTFANPDPTAPPKIPIVTPVPVIPEHFRPTSAVVRAVILENEIPPRTVNASLVFISCIKPSNCSYDTNKVEYKLRLAGRAVVTEPLRILGKRYAIFLIGENGGSVKHPSKTTVVVRGFVGSFHPNCTYMLMLTSMYIQKTSQISTKVVAKPSTLWMDLFAFAEAGTPQHLPKFPLELVDMTVRPIRSQSRTFWIDSSQQEFGLRTELGYFKLQVTPGTHVLGTPARRVSRDYRQSKFSTHNFHMTSMTLFVAYGTASLVSNYRHQLNHTTTAIRFIRNRESEGDSVISVNGVLFDITNSSTPSVGAIPSDYILVPNTENEVLIKDVSNGFQRNFDLCGGCAYTAVQQNQGVGSTVQFDISRDDTNVKEILTQPYKTHYFPMRVVNIDQHPINGGLADLSYQPATLAENYEGAPQSLQLIFQNELRSIPNRMGQYDPPNGTWALPNIPPMSYLPTIPFPLVQGVIAGLPTTVWPASQLCVYSQDVGLMNYCQSIPLTPLSDTRATVQCLSYNIQIEEVWLVDNATGKKVERFCQPQYHGLDSPLHSALAPPNHYQRGTYELMVMYGLMEIRRVYVSLPNAAQLYYVLFISDSGTDSIRHMVVPISQTLYLNPGGFAPILNGPVPSPTARWVKAVYLKSFVYGMAVHAKINGEDILIPEDEYISIPFTDADILEDVDTHHDFLYIPIQAVCVNFAKNTAACKIGWIWYGSLRVEFSGYKTIISRGTYVVGDFTLYAHNDYLRDAAGQPQLGSSKAKFGIRNLCPCPMKGSLPTTEHYRAEYSIGFMETVIDNPYVEFSTMDELNNITRLVIDSITVDTTYSAPKCNLMEMDTYFNIKEMDARPYWWNYTALILQFMCYESDASLFGEFGARLLPQPAPYNELRITKSRPPPPSTIPSPPGGVVDPYFRIRLISVSNHRLIQPEWDDTNLAGNDDWSYELRFAGDHDLGFTHDDPLVYCNFIAGTFTTVWYWDNNEMGNDEFQLTTQPKTTMTTILEDEGDGGARRPPPLSTTPPPPGLPLPPLECVWLKEISQLDPPLSSYGMLLTQDCTVAPNPHAVGMRAIALSNKQIDVAVKIYAEHKRAGTPIFVLTASSTKNQPAMPTPYKFFDHSVYRSNTTVYVTVTVNRHEQFRMYVNVTYNQLYTIGITPHVFKIVEDTCFNSSNQPHIIIVPPPPPPPVPPSSTPTPSTIVNPVPSGQQQPSPSGHKPMPPPTHYASPSTLTPPVPHYTPPTTDQPGSPPLPPPTTKAPTTVQPPTPTSPSSTAPMPSAPTAPNKLLDAQHILMYSIIGGSSFILIIILLLACVLCKKRGKGEDSPHTTKPLLSKKSKNRKKRSSRKSNNNNSINEGLVFYEPREGEDNFDFTTPPASPAAHRTCTQPILVHSSRSQASAGEQDAQ